MNKRDMVSSLAFKFIDGFSVKIIAFIVNVFLARLLDPENFGVVAIFMAVVSILQVLIDGGLSTALIQTNKIERTDYSTVFYISVGMAILLYGLGYLISPLLMSWYNLEMYLLHFRVLLLLTVSYAIGSIPVAKLSREMQFKKIMICNVLSAIISGVSSVVLACIGFGVWALVSYYLMNSVVTCVVYFVASKWYPTLVFSVQRAKELCAYGYKILVSGMLCSLFLNLRTFVIGKLYATRQVAIYSKAQQLPSLLSSTIDNVFNAVMLPALSRKQDDHVEVKKALKNTIAFNTYLSAPCLLGLAAVAPACILCLYTDKWSGCIPFMQIFCLSQVFTSISAPCLVAIKALGRSDIYLKLETVRRLVMIVVLLVSMAFHSLVVIAVGAALSRLIDTIIIFVYMHRLIGYSVQDIVADTGCTFLISIFMATIVYMVGKLAVSAWMLLVLQVCVGVVLYVLLSRVFRSECYNQLVSVVIGSIKRNKRREDYD